jgi:hypothetical protein
VARRARGHAGANREDHGQEKNRTHKSRGPEANSPSPAFAVAVNTFGRSLIGCNPAADNVEGGFSSIEEKSLDGIKESGNGPV